MCSEQQSGGDAGDDPSADVTGALADPAAEADSLLVAAASAREPHDHRYRYQHCTAIPVAQHHKGVE